MNNRDNIKYLQGFDNELLSEAPGFEGALPPINNPQRPKFGLYSEQLSGTAFTAPRRSNKRSWLYRKRPSVCHEPFEPYNESFRLQFEQGKTFPSQIRWFPFEDYELSSPKDFVSGLHLVAYSNTSASSFIAIYVYIFNSSMCDRSFVNGDGDLLFVPQMGELSIRTEFGRMHVKPNEIAVIQQGMNFSVDIEKSNEETRGYLLEVKGNHFELPELGVIGANGLANRRDFQIPTAHVEENDKPYKLILKFQNQLFIAHKEHTPYDVAAWFGNYTPYKYDLDKYVSMNSVSVDHPDPSIFTVLTCQSEKAGTALADFVIFPPRWECASATFRPPYFHRNCMNEFMGLIRGQYQAKSAKFAPGGASLHQSMIPHGPDFECHKSSSEQDTTIPKRIADGTMAFMFETSLALKLTPWAISQRIDKKYFECWEQFGK